MGRLTAEFLDTPVLLQALAGAAREDLRPAQTGVLNVFEVVHALIQRGKEPLLNRVFDRLQAGAQALTRRRMVEASRLRIRHKDRGLSYADAAGYVTARELGAVFVTTDRGFRGLPGVRLLDRASPS